MSQHTLFYLRPARSWDEALPVGNGRLGAMIFGGVSEEIIELNEDTLWSGYPKKREDEDFYRNLERVRQLLAAQDRVGADQFIGQNMLKFNSAGYLPAGKIKLTFAAPPSPDYRRELDLATANQHTVNGGEEREWIASFPHQVLAMHYRGEGFTLGLDSLLEHDLGQDGNDLYLEGRCPVRARYGELRQRDDVRACGIRYRVQVRVMAPASTLRRKDNALTFTGGEAVILVAIRTSFIDWRTLPDDFSYAARCRADLDRAAQLSFAELREAHVTDYQKLYQRSRLELPETAADLLPTDERLRNCQQEFTPALAALLYHFGRYLLIAASRPGTQPANLQGIWNPLPLPPWGCNYTTNINLQMNYWHAEAANLSECAEPLFAFARECAQSGAATARQLYHADGWCLHHNSDLWRFTLPASGQARWGFWPVGGLWICRHLFEHYQYTLDADFLRQYFPVLRGAAAFVLDTLVKDADGYYTTGPATSPENGYLDPATGKAVCVCRYGSAMDLELTREILEHTVKAARILNIDDPLLARAETVLDHLRPLGIGAEGQLLEYDEDYQEAEITHRHLSHLYGVYPGELFTPEQNRDLLRASEVSLVRRQDHSTGWAMGWRLALWARFHNPGKTKIMLKEFLTPIDPAAAMSQNGGIYPNLFAAHPPFQIDANFGVAAGILEMLIQSHRRTAEGVMILELLPAIPDDWTHGCIDGVRCRNALTVCFAWQDRQITKLEMTSQIGQTIMLITPGGAALVDLAAGETVIKHNL